MNILSSILEWILKFLPIPVIVRNTHGGVIWWLGKYAREMKPGWYVVWPLIADHEVVVAARQTLNLSTQALITKDSRQVVASAIIVYSITDIMKAIGGKNYDVTQTVSDMALSSICSVVIRWEFAKLCEELDDKVRQQLTSKCRRELKEFGVEVEDCAITDFTTARTIRLMGDAVSV